MFGKKKGNVIDDKVITKAGFATYSIEYAIRHLNENSIVLTSGDVITKTGEKLTVKDGNILLSKGWFEDILKHLYEANEFFGDL